MTDKERRNGVVEKSHGGVCSRFAAAVHNQQRQRLLLVRAWWWVFWEGGAECGGCLSALVGVWERFLVQHLKTIIFFAHDHFPSHLTSQIDEKGNLKLEK